MRTTVVDHPLIQHKLSLLRRRETPTATIRQLVTAFIDRELNDKGYILPGLGDAGDRIYGTE